jgi:dihydroorotate dehydrogenase
MEKLLKTRFHFWSYEHILKPIFFKFDPEYVHNKFNLIGRILGSNILTKKIVSLSYAYKDKRLKQKLAGIVFENPIGLAAGFDKDAEMISIMEDVGFGFVEVGSITKNPYKGNDGKRLKRIPEKKSLWVYYGLKNKGVKEISERLRKRKYKIPFGLSIAPTNCSENLDIEKAIEDYAFSVEYVKGIGNYITVNISCPNAKGGQPFTILENYKKLFERLGKIKVDKPIFIKISPDLDKKVIFEIMKFAYKKNVKGLIFSNLTKKHDIGKGGLSGKVVEDKSNEILEFAYRKNKENNFNFVLVGCGGVFSAEDAYKKIKKGANLIQLITGMIYEGPQLIGDINYGLSKLLEKDGLKNISEAVGKDIKI